MRAVAVSRAEAGGFVADLAWAEYATLEGRPALH
jgi:hypothetical protein